MSTKLITTSLRNNSSGKPTFFVNLRPTLVDELQIKTNPHVELTGTAGHYKLRFLSKQTARSRKVSIKESYAYVGFSPEMFKLDHTEPVGTFSIDAEYIDGALEFDFDMEEFLKPRSTLSETKKIATSEEKEAAGFKVDTAWGVKVQGEMDDRMARLIWESMKKKFEGDYDDE